MQLTGNPFIKKLKGYNKSRTGFEFVERANNYFWYSAKEE